MFTWFTPFIYDPPKHEKKRSAKNERFDFRMFAGLRERSEAIRIVPT